MQSQPGRRAYVRSIGRPGLQVSGYAALFWRRQPLVALWCMLIAGGHLSLEAYALAVVLQGHSAPATEMFSSLILRCGAETRRICVLSRVALRILCCASKEG